MMRIRVRRTLPLWVAALPLAVLVVAVGLIYRADISVLIGKDPTLTGRTKIWAVAFEGIWQRPVFGWGYSAYWRQLYLRPIFNYNGPPHSHDGFIDVLVDTGFFGMGIFALILFNYISMCMKKVLDHRVPLSNFSAYAFLLLVIFLAMNFTESNLLRYHQFLWLPFISVYTALSLEATEEHAASLAESAEVERPVYQIA